jgi:hypothetical protein
MEQMRDGAEQLAQYLVWICGQSEARLLFTALLEDRQTAVERRYHAGLATQRNEVNLQFGPNQKPEKVTGFLSVDSLQPVNSSCFLPTGFQADFEASDDALCQDFTAMSGRSGGANPPEVEAFNPSAR